MKFIDRPDLPVPLVKALTESNSKYFEDLKEHFDGVNEEFDFQISVTSLIKSPRQVQLTKRHYNDVTADPLKECFFTMQGSIIHYVLESYAGDGRSDDEIRMELIRNLMEESKNEDIDDAYDSYMVKEIEDILTSPLVKFHTRKSDYIREARLGSIIEIDGVRVYFHGQMDLFEKKTATLTDWKYTSANSLLYPNEDYVYQLNALRWLAYKNASFPHRIEKLQNVYIFRHLDKRWMDNPLYPKENAQVKDVPMKTRAEVEEWLHHRIRLHLNDKDKEDDQLSFCSDEERWMRDSEWKVLTKTVKGDRFKKTADYRGKLEEVNAYIKQNNLHAGQYQLEEKKGTPTKCNGFCLGRDFCNQYKQEHK